MDMMNITTLSNINISFFTSFMFVMNNEKFTTAGGVHLQGDPEKGAIPCKASQPDKKKDDLKVTFDGGKNIDIIINSYDYIAYDESTKTLYLNIRKQDTKPHFIGTDEIKIHKEDYDTFLFIDCAERIESRFNYRFTYYDGEYFIQKFAQSIKQAIGLMQSVESLEEIAQETDNMFCEIDLQCRGAMYKDITLTRLKHNKNLRYKVIRTDKETGEILESISKSANESLIGVTTSGFSDFVTFNALELEQNGETTTQDDKNEYRLIVLK